MDINVNFSQDQDYRYKMPMPYIYNVGQGNGKRFIFSNIKQIAYKMFKTPEILSKFLQTEMGSRASINAAGHYVSTGWADYQELLTRLKKFVFYYVLCKHCGNPETYLEIRQNELYFKCSACGKDFSVQKSEQFPLVKMLCREVYKPVLSKRNKTRPEEIRAKLHSILQSENTNSQILQNQIAYYVDYQALLEEEVPVAVVAAFTSKDPPGEKFPDRLAYVISTLYFDVDRYLAVLYAIECAYKRWEQAFKEHHYFLAFIFYRLYLSGAISSPCFVDFREKQNISYVPEEYHQYILEKELYVFYDWFWSEGVEDSFEAEEDAQEY